SLGSGFEYTPTDAIGIEGDEGWASSGGRAEIQKRGQNSVSARAAKVYTQSGLAHGHAVTREGEGTFHNLRTDPQCLPCRLFGKQCKDSRRSFSREPIASVCDTKRSCTQRRHS